MEATEQANEPILVIEISASATPCVMQRLLAEPLPSGYYLWDTLVWPSGGVRAIYKLKRSHTTAVAKKLRDNSGETAAIQFIRDHKAMSISQLRNALEATGFKRGRTWISNKRLDIRHSE